MHFVLANESAPQTAGRGGRGASCRPCLQTVAAARRGLGFGVAFTLGTWTSQPTNRGVTRHARLTAHAHSSSTGSRKTEGENILVQASERAELGDPAQRFPERAGASRGASIFLPVSHETQC